MFLKHATTGRSRPLLVLTRKACAAHVFLCLLHHFPRKQRFEQQLASHAARIAEADRGGRGSIYFVFGGKPQMIVTTGANDVARQIPLSRCMMITLAPVRMSFKRDDMVRSHHFRQPSSAASEY